MNTYIKTFFILAVAVWMSCCNMGRKDKNYYCDDIMHFTLSASLRDSIMSEPNAGIDILKKMRENTNDSISSYALLIQISNCYHWAGKIDSAMMALQKVVDFCERSEPSPCLPQLQAEACVGYGNRLSYTEEYDSAIVHLKKGVDAMMKSENLNRLPNVYTTLAICYEMISDFPQAIHFYKRAIFTADSLNQRKALQFTRLFSLANLFSEMENIEQAECYFQEAEKYWDEVSDIDKAFLCNYKGNHYTNVVKDYQKALEYHQQYNRFTQSAQSSYLSLPFRRSLAAVNLAEVYLLMEQTDSASFYIERAKEWYQQSEPWATLEYDIIGLSAMLALKENRLDDAEKILSKQMLVNSDFVEPSIIHKTNEQLEELYARKNDFKNAYHYRLKINAYDDSVRNTKVRNNIAEMEMRYRQDTTLLRKDLRIAVVEKSASRWQNIALLSLLLLVLIATAAGAFILYTRRKREQEYRRQVAIVTGLRMEIVRNRVQPHFVFNALNVMIPSLEQHKELERPFRLLIQMLRNNLRASEQVAVPLEEEMGLVKNFLMLHEIGGRHKIAVNWQVADDVPADARIPSMAIQIPVENAVKYAFMPEQKEPRIDVRITRMNNMIGIVIDDNGVGFQPGATGAFSERGTGSGLKMLRRTVELLNLRNSIKMIFEIENKQQLTHGSHGTRVTLLVPFDYHFVM